MTTTCTIHTWHGTYRLSSGGRTDGASSSDSLFFLIASLRRRDPEALQGMAQAGPGLLSHSLPVFHHTRELPDSLLESIASDLQWRVASGQLSVEKIDLLKNLHVRDMPPPPPEIIEEPPEEVIAAAPVDEPAPPTTAWYEVVVTDENEMPIKNAKVIFTIGGQTYTVPTDSEGKARIEDVEEQEATAKIELPDDSASSAAADQNDAAAITEDAAAESDTPPVHCDFVEIPDILFHHGTAVPCLDSSGALLGALVTTLDFARSNPDKEVILFGHTDTSGDPSYNFDLSQWRAEGIKALLDNDVNTWLDVIDLASKVEDYQATLKALATAHGWPCDPGAVDNNSGPKTKTAVKAFQEQYNTRKSGSLKPDGVMGPKTWSALFAVMRDLLNAAWTAHTKEPALPALTYGHNGKGIYPCGESFPIEAADKDNYKSATNRRVEITFFDKGTAPELKAPADKKKVEKQEAPVYDGEKTERKVIPVKKAEPVLGDSIVLEFIFPQVNDASKPHKQYVNLDADGKANGPELTIRVKPKDPKAATSDKRVYWRVTAADANSKRSDPKTGIKKDSGAALVEFTQGIASTDTPFTNNESSLVLACGVAGGDRFTVEAGTDGENFTSTVLVENWRRLWYEIICPDFTDLDKKIDALGNELLDYPVAMKTRLANRAAQIFVELLHYKSHTFTEAQAPAGSVFKSEQLGYPAGKKGYVLTDHTFKSNPKEFDKGKRPRSIHIKLCNRNFFFESGNMALTIDTYTLTTKTLSISITDWYAGFFLPLSAENGLNSIKLFTWRAKIDPALHSGHPGIKNGSARSGDLSSDAIKFISVRKIDICLPDTNPDDPGNIVGPRVTATKCPIEVDIEFECAQEGLGLAGQGTQKGELLSFYNPSAREASIDVLLHEIGHCAGLTVYNGIYKPPEGLPYPKTVNEVTGGNRGNVYTGKNHSGSHCAFGLTDVQKSQASFSNLPGTCIMFGESAGRDPSGAQGFCDECQTYFRARELDDIEKDWNI